MLYPSTRLFSKNGKLVLIKVEDEPEMLRFNEYMHINLRLVEDNGSYKLEYWKESHDEIDSVHVQAHDVTKELITLQRAIRAHNSKM